MLPLSFQIRVFSPSIFSFFIFCFSFVYLYDIMVSEKEVLHLQQGAKMNSLRTFRQKSWKK